MNSNPTIPPVPVLPVPLGEVIDEVIDRLIAQRKDAAIADLVRQIDEKNERIRELEAQCARLSWAAEPVTTAPAHLAKVGAHLRFAHSEALDATEQLSGARQTRGAELTELLADAIAFVERLSFVVAADDRYQQERDR